MLQFVDDFATPEFIEDNKSFYDKYIEYRIHGYSQQTAFMRVFGSDHWPDVQQGFRRVEQMESTDYYKSQFTSRLQATKTEDLWNPKLSVHELLATVRGPYVKDSVKLSAIKELNVLAGITIIDENGKTKAGRSLDDFYAKEGDGNSSPEPTR